MKPSTLASKAKTRLRSIKRLASSYISALRARVSLPPGRLYDLHKREFTNQKFLLDCMTRYGPVFKSWQDNSIVVCVVGLDRIRRLMSEREDLLRPVSVPVAAPFPKGLMRVMEGLDHKKYRSQLNAALKVDQSEAKPGFVDATVVAEVDAVLATIQDAPPTHIQLDALLTRISTGVLLQMFFGLKLGTRPYEDLMRMYSELGPDGYVMQVGASQRSAFERIQQFLVADLGRLMSDRVIGRNSVLGNMSGAGDLDDVALGNLIYMVEIGRYDLTGLFRWMLSYASRHPDLQRQLALAEPSQQQSLALAYVYETLRLSQIERLLRSVREPFVFDGFYFPRHALVRVCLWESHKLPELFDEPFDFCPQRFATSDSLNDILPFGVGKHRCPMASNNLHIGARFICALVGSYQIAETVEENPYRGRHHWEPAKEFNVGIGKRVP